MLSDDDVDKYLKRRFVYSIGESIEILKKINKNKERKENTIRFFMRNSKDLANKMYRFIREEVKND